jgi:hypothetical protein
MIIQSAFPGAQSLVSFQFYGLAGMLGAAITAGIAAPVAALPGLYVASATPPAGAIGVYWSCNNPALQSYEDLRDALALASIVSANPDAGSLTALAASLALVQAAVYDSVSVAGSVLTLSNGATQNMTNTGRVTAPPPA